MWVLLDNYDSFTYILHDYLLQTGNECVVYRNDELTLQQLIDISPERIIISPGPETPLQSGICISAIDYFHNRIPILGVCLGHQALGMYFGAQLTKLAYPMHGKESLVTHIGHPLFNNLTDTFTVMRYHSLAVDQFAGTGLKEIAHSMDDNIIMGLAHEQYPCLGVQFHPESIGTKEGLQLLRNWSAMYR